MDLPAVQAQTGTYKQMFSTVLSEVWYTPLSATQGFDHFLHTHSPNTEHFAFSKFAGAQPACQSQHTHTRYTLRNYEISI